jgi:hypothetical protein
VETNRKKIKRPNAFLIIALLEYQRYGSGSLKRFPAVARFNLAGT